MTSPAKEALKELRSVCPQYGYPRFDVLAKIIENELDGIQHHSGEVEIVRVIDPIGQGTLL